MGITWGDVVQWDSAPLHAAVGEMNTACNKLVACTDDARTLAAIEGWRGDAATAAVAEGNAIIDALESYTADAAALRRSTGDVADAMDGVRNAVTETEALASAQRFTINPDNSLTDHGPDPGTPPGQLDAVTRERQVTAAELADRVTQVLRTATDIDDDFCVVLDRILANQTIDPTQNDNTQTSLAAAGNAGHAMGSLSIPSPPAEGATAAQNAAYWATLSGTQRTRLAHDHPHLVGPRDGFTAVHRHLANRELLGRERTRLQGMLGGLEEEFRTHQHRVPPQKYEQLQQLKGKLADLDALGKMVTLPTGEPRPGRQLLLLDTGGDRLKAAVGSGNVDTADHVAVFTPGMNTTAGNLDEDVREMDQIRTDAEKMTEKKPGGAESVAMVTWLGYQPPSTSSVGEVLVDAAGGQEAQHQAGKLASFYEGISESRRDDPPHLTALGHSYGSLTTGIALNQPGTGVDDVVFFGSPGIAEGPSPSTEAAQEIRKLQIPDGHAYNLEADGDVIADIPSITERYGTDLDSMPGMNQLSTHEATGPDGQRLAASSGHSEYTKILPDNARSTSARNIAAIVAGMPHLTIAEPG